MAEEIKKKDGNESQKVGRKWFDLTDEDIKKGRTEEFIVSQFKEVWSIGGTDKEAATFASISKSALSRYLDDHPELREIRDRFKEKPILKARRTIDKNLDTVETAKWYLEKKRKSEFGNALDVTSGGDKLTTYTNEQITSIAKRAIDISERDGEEGSD